MLFTYQGTNWQYMTGQMHILSPMCKGYQDSPYHKPSWRHFSKVNITAENLISNNLIK